jgi:hypothetical protein
MPDKEKWAAGGYGLFYGEAYCSDTRSSSVEVHAECDEPFDWTIPGGWNDTLPVGALCICVQP